MKTTHTFIKRKQGKIFLGMLVYADIFWGMADTPDTFWGYG